MCTTEVKKFDVAIIGAGMAGMATAARLQAQGLQTLVLEAHTKIGGCAGYFRRRGFSFDVGATTLVDFEPNGVGGELLSAIQMPPLQGDLLPGYVAWLPDKTVTLYRDKAKWARERLAAFGNTPAHHQFWALLDQLAEVFWDASRQGIKLPMQHTADIVRNIKAVGIKNLMLARYLSWSMGDALRHFGLRDDAPLVGLLGMLIEDTVHSTVDHAPLINAALGVTIRGAGLTRHQGGMCGFWDAFTAHYRGMGGDVRVHHRVEKIEGRKGNFTIYTSRGNFTADQVVCSLPAALTQQIAPQIVGDKLRRKVTRDDGALGGAIVVCLGVPESDVAAQDFTHHQLLQDYAAPLGDGNNMFISVSAAGDLDSAPPHHRAVMISTHCALDTWQNLSKEDYENYKCETGRRLIEYARRVYPQLATRPLVYEIGTPQTYARFTNRPLGAVGGVRLTRMNSNQFAIAHNIGVAGFWLAGDTTFPGLGTVACVLGSRIVAEYALKERG